MKKSERRR